ncbi:MAG: hypothetical protein J7M14_01085, partial [Planctomycetes bacterium]|nr:hypothetical protein [Planctomycetota bacterium]
RSCGCEAGDIAILRYVCLQLSGKSAIIQVGIVVHIRYRPAKLGGVDVESVSKDLDGRLSAAADVEARLAASLSETAGEVARSECFDDEQRAEVYVILDALRSDSKAHRETVGVWINDRIGKIGRV